MAEHLENSPLQQSVEQLPLTGKRVLFFTGDIYEDLELWYPKLRLIEAGASVVVAGERAGEEYSGKPVAAICHGGWIPISAGIYRGLRVTGSPGIKDDLVNAGALYEDASVVVDRNSISSRRPDDLPDFCRSLIAMMSTAAS